MKDSLIVMAVAAVMLFLAYNAGYRDAQTRYEAQATIAAQVVKEAVSRASDALSALTQNVSTAEGRDADKLKEIEDAALADGTVCHVPVDRLRGLDAIAN